MSVCATRGGNGTALDVRAEREEPQVRHAAACLLCVEPGRIRYEGLRDGRCATPGEWRWRHCGPCGVMWLDPRPAGEGLARLYANYYTHEQGKPPGGWERWRESARLALLSSVEGYEGLASRAWQRRLGRAARLLGPLDEMARLALMGLGGERKGRLLDVGCGSGRLLELLRRAGWDVAGVEPDPRAAAVARERYGVSVHAGPLAEAPFEEHSFDAIVLSHVIEHVEDPVALLTACRGLLREGGRLAVSTPNLESRGHRRFGPRWLHLDVPRHLHLFSASSLAVVLERAGFTGSSVTTAAKSAASTWLSSRANSGQRGLGPLALLRAAGFHLAEWRAVNRGEGGGEELFAWATGAGGDSPTRRIRNSPISTARLQSASTVVCDRGIQTVGPQRRGVPAERVVAGGGSGAPTDEARANTKRTPTAAGEGNGQSKTKPVVGAIVLNYLNWEQTVETVNDLLAQTGVELDVVIVDNASPNESFERLEACFGSQPRVALTASGRNGGYARGNNHGARRRLEAAPLDYLLIVNNDVRLPRRDAVKTLAAFAAAHADAGMVGPRVVTRAGFAQGPYRRPHPLVCCLRYALPIFPLGHRLWRRLWSERWRERRQARWLQRARWFGRTRWLAQAQRSQRTRWLGRAPWLWQPALRPGESSRACFALVGACLLAPAAAFERAGMFDEATFLGAEEYILAERMRALGLRSYYVPAARVVHHHESSAIRRTGGETRYLLAGVASMAYYFRRYQQAPESWIRLFELTAKLYGRFLLPLRQRLPL